MTPNGMVRPRSYPAVGNLRQAPWTMEHALSGKVIPEIAVVGIEIGKTSSMPSAWIAVEPSSRCLAKANSVLTFALAAYNLIRLPKLLEAPT